jgi:hypothetical protein
VPKRTLHVNLSPEAVASLDPSSHQRNRAGRTLRDWLVRSFEASHGRQRTAQTSFFGTTVEVDDDVPLLLEALGRVTKRSPDELVEAWALETRADDRPGDSTPAAAVHISDDVRGKVADLLDLGETLFEETVSDARRKLGSSYSEGDKAAQVGADLFKGLRALLGLSEPNSNAGANEKGANVHS